MGSASDLKWAGTTTKRTEAWRGERATVLESKQTTVTIRDSLQCLLPEEQSGRATGQHQHPTWIPWFVFDLNHGDMASRGRARLARHPGGLLLGQNNNSGKTKGGGLCVCVNLKWCSQFTREFVCNLDSELVCLSLPSFLLPPWIWEYFIMYLLKRSAAETEIVSGASSWTKT